jgi:RHS repeat-associated protein
MLMRDGWHGHFEAENAAWGMSTYLYDPLGRRKQKVVGAGSAMPVATDFVLAGGKEIADYYETSATWRLTVPGAGGLPLAAVVPAAGGAGEEIVYVHHDAKGSTVALTEPGGNGPAETYTYSDYGQPQSGSWLAYQYAGYRNDAESGLNYVRARYYSPALGRFLQADPVGFDGGLNMYGYAGNDPINLADPTGLTPEVVAEDSLTMDTSFMRVFGINTVNISATSRRTPSKTGCFLKGAISGAATTLLVAGVATIAVPVVGPAAVTIGLGVLTVAGTASLAGVAYNDAKNKNWAGIAFDAGSFAGSLAAGMAGGPKLANAIDPNATPGWSPKSWIDQAYDPSKGSLLDLMGKGPTDASAGLSSGAAGWLSSLFGEGCH